jgi:hypothetical protein
MVLTEAGYRCAVPTCRSILALDMHHIEEVSEEGSNDLGNLIALCPTCHALYTRGTICRDSIRIWKGMLVALGQAFDRESIDSLLFLGSLGDRESPIISGDAVMRYSKLITASLVDFQPWHQRGQDRRHAFTFFGGYEGDLFGYTVSLTSKGLSLIGAWKSGNREALSNALGLHVEAVQPPGV